MKIDLGIVIPIENLFRSKLWDFYQKLEKNGLTVGILNINTFNEQNQIEVFNISSKENIIVHIESFKIIHALDFELKNENYISLLDKWNFIVSFCSALKKYGVGIVNSFESISFFYSKQYLFNCINFLPDHVIPTFSTYQSASKQFKNIITKPLCGESSKGVVRRHEIDISLVSSDALIFQPDMSENNSLMEYSLVFFNDRCVNSVTKYFTSKNGQEKLLNINTEYYNFNQEELELGLSFMNLFKEELKPQIWRFDFIKHKGKNLLMELEAVDPYHYEEFAPNFYWENLKNFYYNIL